MNKYVHDLSLHPLSIHLVLRSLTDSPQLLVQGINIQKFTLIGLLKHLEFSEEDALFRATLDDTTGAITVIHYCDSESSVKPHWLQVLSCLISPVHPR